MKSVAEVRAVAGQGLEGDCYFLRTGTYSPKHEPAREVTLIEIEAIDALERDYGVKLGPGDARRNIVTRGVALNHLVGKEFRVGEAVLRGIRLCEPCQRLSTTDGARESLAGAGASWGPAGAGCERWRDTSRRHSFSRERVYLSA
jgi:MOSC domain-containing protein YiiM